MSVRPVGSASSWRGFADDQLASLILEAFNLIAAKDRKAAARKKRS
jgi:hypothetical protein